VQMTLDNLAKIGRLKPHVASKPELADLLTAARSTRHRSAAALARRPGC